MGVIINRDNTGSIQTRHADKLMLPKANSSFFQKTFVFLAPKFYNSINKNSLNLKTSNLLKKSLKDYLLNIHLSRINDFFTILT
jgi:hypothetical protein